MITKIYSKAQTWLKDLFGANTFFSYFLFPVNVLVFYIMSILILFSKVFHIWQGVSYIFIIRSSRYISYLAAVTFLIFTFIFVIEKDEKLEITNSKEKFQSGDLLLLLLPLMPVVQYVIKNMSILSLLDSIWIILFFLGLSLFFAVIVPALFRKISSTQILPPMGLSFIFTITNMALLTQSNNWYDEGDFLIQWLVFGGTFLAIWVFYHFNWKQLLRLLIVVYFASNTVMQVIGNEDLKSELITTVEQTDISDRVEENKLLMTIGDRTPPSTPNIYLLVYDAYVANETMMGYGIDNSAQEEFLANSGFTLYPQTYSVGDTTLGTMSRVLNASMEFYGTRRTAVSGNGVVHNLLKDYGYETIGLFPFDYFFREDSPSYDSYIPEYKSSPSELLISAILMGEFRFDLGFDAISHDQFIETSQSLFEEVSGDPVFIYMHSKRPSHSQNSGTCRPNETDLYEARLAEANIEMREDIRIIQENDPGAIIIVAGDHGAFLTRNCVRYVDFDVSELNRLDIQDRFGTFLAIKWPSQDFEAYDEITVIQDVFPAVFSYLYSDPVILEAKVDTITISSEIVVQDGFIVGGVDDGEPLFLAGD